MSCIHPRQSLHHPSLRVFSMARLKGADGARTVGPASHVQPGGIGRQPLSAGNGHNGSCEEQGTQSAQHPSTRKTPKNSHVGCLYNLKNLPACRGVCALWECVACWIYEPFRKSLYEPQSKLPRKGLDRVIWDHYQRAEEFRPWLIQGTWRSMEVRISAVIPSY